MSRIEFANGSVQIDAADLARALQISTDALKHGMRDGKITSQFERGEGEDAGTVRLTFYSAIRRVRVTADGRGNVLECNVVVAGKPLLQRITMRP